MGFYNKSPFKGPVQLLVAGTPSYVFGSYNDKTGPTTGYVLSDSSIGTTATINVKIMSGNIPIVGSLITVVGTASSAGAFNSTNSTVTAVSSPQSPDTGFYSISYTIASTTQATTADAGQFIIPQIEVGDALTSTGASIEVASPFNNPEMQEGKSITVSVSFPTAPTSATVVIQGANLNADSEFQTIGTIITAGNTSSAWQSGQGDSATGTLASGSVPTINFRFYRLNVTALTGTGTIVGKIEI